MFWACFRIPSWIKGIIILSTGVKTLKFCFGNCQEEFLSKCENPLIQKYEKVKVNNIFIFFSKLNQKFHIIINI